MKINTCPECRKAMRCWANDWRRESNPEIKALCLKTALSFRSGECFHKRSTGERQDSQQPITKNQKSMSRIRIDPPAAAGSRPYSPHLKSDRECWELLARGAREEMRREALKSRTRLAFHDREGAFIHLAYAVRARGRAKVYQARANALKPQLREAA